MLNITSIPGQPSCAGYWIKVLDQPTHSKSAQNAVLANTCVLNGQFEYLPIAPWATYVQKIDLGVYLDLQVRGDYILRQCIVHFGERRVLRQSLQQKQP
jgi:hypothetical protein